MNTQTNRPLLKEDFTIYDLMEAEGYTSVNSLAKRLGIAIGGVVYSQFKNGTLSPFLYAKFKKVFPYYNFMHMLDKGKTTRKGRGPNKAKIVSLTGTRPLPEATIAAFTVPLTTALVEREPLLLRGTWDGQSYMPHPSEVRNTPTFRLLNEEIEELKATIKKSSVQNETPITIIRIMEENSKLRLATEMDSAIREIIRNYKEQHIVGSATQVQTRHLAYLYVTLEKYTKS